MNPVPATQALERFLAQDPARSRLQWEARQHSGGWRGPSCPYLSACLTARPGLQMRQSPVEQVVCDHVITDCHDACSQKSWIKPEQAVTSTITSLD